MYKNLSSLCKNLQIQNILYRDFDIFCIIIQPLYIQKDIGKHIFLQMSIRWRKHKLYLCVEFLKDNFWRILHWINRIHFGNQNICLNLENNFDMGMYNWDIILLLVKFCYYGMSDSNSMLNRFYMKLNIFDRNLMMPLKTSLRSMTLRISLQYLHNLTHIKCIA